MMTGRLFFASMVVIGMVSASSMAQVRPSLSGEWELIPGATAASAAPRSRPGTEPGTPGESRGRGPRPGNTGGGGFECGGSCTITQAGTTLGIRQHTTAAAAPPEIVLNVTGAESKTTRPEWGGGPPIESITKAQWDGNKLLVTRWLGSVARIDQVISFEAGKLTIVTTHYVSGATYTGGPKPIIFTYKKQ